MSHKKTAKMNKNRNLNSKSLDHTVTVCNAMHAVDMNHGESWEYIAGSALMERIEQLELLYQPMQDNLGIKRRRLNVGVSVCTL